MEKKIKIALDSSLLINIFALINPKNDKEGKIINALKNKTLNAEDWKCVPSENFPLILKDRFLGHRVKSVYPNLMDIYNIWTWITNGDIEAYITPTAFNELEDMNEIEEGFLKKYIKVLTINPDQEDYIFSHIDALAKEYVKNNAIKEEYIPELRRKSPTRDAYIMSEASLCGLSLVTCDWKDLINSSLYVKDYTKTSLIKKINREYKGVNLCFKSITNQNMTTTAVLFSKFVIDVKQNNLWLYTGGKDININENNEITLK